MTPTVRDWNSTAGSMSLDTVRERHQPSRCFRVSKYCYDAGERVVGAGRAGLCYVLAGSCMFTAGGVEVHASAGQVVEFSAGDHSVLVPTDAPVELVFVWRLPPGFEAPED